LEGFNVEKTTAVALNAGGFGHMLEDAARSLGGTIVRWEPIRNGGIWNLRAHLSYP